MGAHHILVQTDSHELSLVLLGFDFSLAFAPACRLLVLLLLTICWIVLLNFFKSVDLFQIQSLCLWTIWSPKPQVSAHHLMNRIKIYGAISGFFG